MTENKHKRLRTCTACGRDSAGVVLCPECGGELTGVHVGVHADRLYDPERNPREVVFARAWELENDTCNRLRLLLGEDEARNMDWPTAISTAATVVQWLGSDVGWEFVEAAVRECGYVLVKEDTYKRLSMNAERWKGKTAKEVKR